MNTPEKISNLEILEKIKEKRNQKNLSQAQVAAVIGISQAAYAKIENGITGNISLNIAKGIARALNESFNKLFEIEMPLQNSDQIEKLKIENESLKKQSDEKSLLIDLQKNEKSHIQAYLVMQMVSEYTFVMGLVDELITEAGNEGKEKLNQKREAIIRNYHTVRDYYLRTGFLSQSDFDNHYMEMKGIYQNIPEK